MIPEKVKIEIMQRLYKTEVEKGVRILMAIESGSRAWGFESKNSDYDVRFIYAHPKDWYVAVDLEEKRDVIEYPIVDEIDLNGWDVRKALRLFYKSNPAIVEWINSPITYIEKGDFRKKILSLLPDFYSIDKGIYHYKSMAKKNYRGYLRDQVVPIKKYFYVLRPLLSIRWLQKYKTPAPIEFNCLLTMLRDPEILESINKLLIIKKSSVELDKAPMVPVLNNFIEEELKQLESFNPDKVDACYEIEDLNYLFHQILNK